MNHGNTNRSEQNLDDIVERLNKKIARLLGKKSNTLPPKKTSNIKFTFIIIIFSIILWTTTGFYYLSESQSGIILSNGNITDVVQGIKVGFTLPYPFGNIEILDTDASEQLNLSSFGVNDDEKYIAITKDLHLLTVDAKFVYQITDPKMFYLKYLQNEDNLDSRMRWNMQQQMHEYLAKKTADEIANANLTVLATELRDIANQLLLPYGLQIIKLNINNIGQLKTAAAVTAKNQTVAVESNTAVIYSKIASELIDEANSYQQNQIVETQANINKYKQLLPQYLANPNAIIEQMYYDLLAVVPVSKSSSYPLLNFNLSQLIALESEHLNTVKSTEATSTEVFRNVSRSVVRERNLNGRQE